MFSYAHGMLNKHKLALNTTNNEIHGFKKNNIGANSKHCFNRKKKREGTNVDSCNGI